jgi:predicted HTH transcriptional regulator
MIRSIKEAIFSTDPLSNEAIGFLLNYREEDTQIDYKESFHGKEERDWLEITKDIMAFANTNGGFLLFGIKNGTFERIGISSEVTLLVGD